MASRVKRQHPVLPYRDAARQAGRIAAEVMITLIVASIFFLKIFAYTDPAALSPSSVARVISLAFHNSADFISNLPILNSCPRELRMQDVSGGYVCVSSSSAGDYSQIYRFYPLVGRGIESIYAGEDGGSMSAANDLLRNQFDVPRYRPLRIPASPTWSENAYSAKDWRFQFYSLRPSLNLLYAFRTTGNVVYARKLISLDLSFASAEGKSQWAWSDPHAVAFRSMALVDTWWKLRQAHQLPEAASNAILGELEKTGQYLADPNHYQQEDNHCVNEAAALYELAVAFPTMPSAHEWLALATERFQWQLNDLIDSDGQLIENSPFYDFYVLEKYWQIYNYSLAHHSPLGDAFTAKLKSMLRFATYILQPNSQVPLLGASTETTIRDHGVYSQLAAADPQLRYVLTDGAQGTEPDDSSVYFPASGLSVMRSGWQRGAAFADSTYLTYNIGRYRTAHSNLDALAITLYGEGGDLLPGAGLYTYQPGAYRDYFHGTASENTVVVDGRSQAAGDAAGTQLVTTGGMTYQSAESSLYSGVTHQRLVMMIDADHLLVVDRLSSTSVHSYQQMFHLFPGAALSRSGLTVSAAGGTPFRQVTIQQLQPDGLAEADVINQQGRHPAGLCSARYGKLQPCYQISYTAHGRNATFVTLITIGKPQQPGFSIRVGGRPQQLLIADGHRHADVTLGESAAEPARSGATDPTPPTVKTTPIPASSMPANWTAAGGGVLSFPRAAGDHIVARLSAYPGSVADMQDDAIRLNLARHNARISLEVNGFAQLTELRLMLSNDNWAKYVTLNLRDCCTRTEAGGWANVFLGPSVSWGPDGGWQASGPGFNWANIDGLRIVVGSSGQPTAGQPTAGQQSTVSVGGLSLIPAQNEAKLVFMFDDGHQSIVPAASYLRQNGMAGNVAVVGEYVDYPTQGHLNIDQLKTLQNNWGWDIVNRGQQYSGAIIPSNGRLNTSSYAGNVLQQAAWLTANGLNSAPNWFIYPGGNTDAELEHVIGRYYMFARVAADGSAAYPYGDPLAVSDLEIQYPGDGGAGDGGAGDEGHCGCTGFTSPSEILSAVHQAIAHHLTLILAFHRIHSGPSDLPGYPLALFKQVVDEIRHSGIKVMTLSQLDRSNGVPVRNRIYYDPARPAQITVRIER